MTSPQMTRLDEHLQRLRLNTVRERLEALLQEASDKELSYADFLDGLLSEEVSAKTAKHVTMRTNLARFPFIKGLDSFDFGYQPSVDRKQIQKLSLCHFVEHGENLVLLGPPGVGKTHLAVGLGLKAIEHGYRVLFTTAAAMLTTLTNALNEAGSTKTGRSHDPAAVDHRRDRVPADRPAGGDAVLSAHQPALRAWADDPDQQPELRQLGRRLRGPGDRQRDPRPDPASRDDDQHPGRFVSAEGQAEVGGGQTDRGGSVSDGRPVDAAGDVDAQTRPQRLGQAADGQPTATTGTNLIDVSTRGGGILE